MLSKELLLRLLQLEDGWEPSDVRFCHEEEQLTVAVKPTESLWANQMCPHCQGRRVALHDTGRTQTWRHLDSFRVKTLIECALPRVKCQECGRLSPVRPNWLGKSRHFTRGFEAYALTVIRETNVKNASRVLCESDQRLWRMLFAYIEGAHGELSTAAINILHREWQRTGPLQMK